MKMVATPHQHVGFFALLMWSFLSVIATTAAQGVTTTTASQALNCSRTKTVCRAALLIDVLTLLHQLTYTQLNTTVGVRKVASFCRDWLTCVNETENDPCSLRDYNLQMRNSRCSSSYYNYNWYWCYYYDSWVSEANFMCNATTVNYSDYYTCMMTGDTDDIFRRCDAFMSLRQNFISSYADYCRYAYERAECFVYYSNQSCTYEMASYILEDDGYGQLYRDSYANCNLDIRNLRKEPFPDSPCNDFEFTYCAAETEEIAFIQSVLEGLLYDNYWYYNNTDGNSFMKNYTADDICRNWNDFMPCIAKTGCSFNDITDVIYRNRYDPDWPFAFNHAVMALNSTLETMFYICDKARSTVEQTCRSDISECQRVNYARYNYPYFRIEDLCSVIYDDAVCVYNTAKQTCNSQTSLKATVDVRVEYQRMWWFHNADRWSIDQPLQNLSSIAKTCAVNFTQLETQSDQGEPCGKYGYFQCLVESSLENYLYSSSGIMSGVLNGWFDPTSDYSCRKWSTFKSCFRCNATFLYKVDFVAAYLDSNQYTGAEDIEQGERYILNEALTPNRLELMCNNRSEGYFAYTACTSNLRDGSLYAAFQDCQQHANATYGAYSVDTACSYYKMWFSCLYTEIMSRQCTVQAATYIMNYFFSEWKSYLQQKVGCIMEIGAGLCSESPCQNQGTCVNLDTGYRCVCVDGFTGSNCERTGRPDCNRTQSVCRAALLVDVSALLHQLTYSQLSTEVGVQRVASFCGDWLTCVEETENSQCSLGYLNRMYGGGSCYYNANGYNSYYDWYWCYHYDSWISLANFMCNATIMDYSDYYTCMMTGNNYDIFRRCDTFWSLRQHSAVSFADYCRYAVEHVECFVYYTNQSCTYDMASYIAKDEDKWRVYRGRYGDCSIDVRNLRKIPFPDSPCNDFEFVYCMAETEEIAFIPDIMEGLLFDGYWYSNNVNGTSFTKNYTADDICRYWNDFMPCVSQTGCSLSEVTDVVIKNVYDPYWPLASQYYAAMFNSTLETMFYICDEARSTVELTCRSNIDDCQTVTNLRYYYPYFRTEDLCSVIYDDAVCVYNSAKQTCNTQASLKATVDVRVKYHRLWWFYYGYYWNTNQSWQDLVSMAKSCVVNFTQVEAHTPPGQTCDNYTYFRCLSESYFRWNLYWPSNVMSSVLSGSFDPTTDYRCSYWNNFKSCFHCNSTFFYKADFVAAYLDYDGYWSPAYSDEEIEEQRRYILNQALTPNRLELVCNNKSEGYVAYKDCSIDLRRRSLYTAFQDCQQQANATYGTYTVGTACSYYKMWFSCLYTEIMSRQCTVQAATYIMNYFFSEWKSYLQQNVGCILDLFPTMQDDPEFVGPASVVRTSPLCSDYTDFYFECRISYDQMDTDARFDVSLTFDGMPDATNADTHVITDSSSLTVVFNSSCLRGNIGKWVSCQVQSYWSGSTTTSNAMRSASRYWVGVNYTVDSRFYNAENDEIEVSASDFLDIEFSPTVPLAISDCSDLAVDFEQTGSRTSGCRLVFNHSSSRFTLSVETEPKPSCEPRTTIIKFLTPASSRSIRTIWDNYTIDDIKIVVTCARPPKMCQSYHEPLIVTFDGLTFITRTYPGDFLLYRSQIGNRLFEVHVRHVDCIQGNPTINCNCAVVVREGNDALGLYSCDGTVTPIRYLADENTPPGKAEITYRTSKPWGQESTGSERINYGDETGDVYEIVMPSGAFIRVRVWAIGSGRYLNVYIYAHSGFAGGRGMCGNYNFNYDDDVAEFGTDFYPTGSIEKYRLREEDSYINGHVFALPCQNAPRPATECKCSGRKPQNCTDAIKRRTVRSFVTPNTDSCQVSAPGARRKRQTMQGQYADAVITEQDIPVPPPQEPGPLLPLPSWPTASNITADQAEQSCRTVLESFPAYNVCLSYVSDNFLNSSCVEQIKLLDSVESGVSMMLDDLKQRCFFSIASSAEANSTDPTKQLDFINAVLQQVELNDCPGQPTACSGHGSCSSGRCTCDKGYTGSACDVDSDSVPKLTRFRRSNLCDARKSPCQTVYISVSDFYASANLTCRVTYADSDADSAFSGAPEVVSKWELACPLPPSPVTKPAGSAVVDLDISVSNDATRYSNSLSMTVYDSLCLDCDSNSTCTQKDDTCLVNGRCYASGDVSSADPCYKCDPQTNTEALVRDNNLPGCAPTTKRPSRPVKKKKKKQSYAKKYRNLMVKVVMKITKKIRNNKRH